MAKKENYKEREEPIKRVKGTGEVRAGGGPRTEQKKGLSYLFVES